MSVDPSVETTREMTHEEWWESGAASEGEAAVTGATPYTDAQAVSSLNRAGRMVLLLTGVGLPLAWFFNGWRGGVALLIGAAISGSGLWEWRRLMAALTARMDASELVQTHTGTPHVKAPSVGFAIAGFTVRLLVVVAVLYGSLSYLHGSVIALAAGLALGVVALTVEAVRLLRSGTI